MRTQKATRYNMNTYPICGSPLKRSARSRFAPLQKSRWNHRFYMWTEALSSMVFVHAQKLSGIAWTAIQYVTLYFADRRGAASLRDRNGAEIIVFDCKKKLYPVWISCRGKNHPILCEYSLKSGLKGVTFIGRRHYIEGELLQSFPLKEL